MLGSSHHRAVSRACKTIPFFFVLVGNAVLIAGCSFVGPGLANHPIDCALGIQWGGLSAGIPGI